MFRSRHKVPEWKKIRPRYMLPKETHFRPKDNSRLKVRDRWGTWVVQLVKHLTSAQVMITQFMI